MRGLLSSFFVIIFVLFSCAAFAAKKQSKQKKESIPATEMSVIEQARQAIVVDPGVTVPHSISPQDTGILVMRAPDLNDDRYPTRFPVGLHLDSYSLSGVAITSNNASYNFSDLGAPLVPSIRLGLVPWLPVLFDAYYVQFGYQQKQISGAIDQSLKLAHHTVTISGENKFYVRGKLDLRYQIEAGLLQSQISSRENSLSNVTKKTSFMGFGLQAHYWLHNSLGTDLGITYRNATAKPEGYNLQPIGIGAGISYIW